MAPKRRPREITDEDLVRFESYILRTDGCHHWIGPLGRGGYGRFGVMRKRILAHRFALMVAGRDLPPGLVCDHLCRNRTCVNVEHMEFVTIGENVLRGDTLSARNRAKTHCSKGHPLSGDNLLVLRGAWPGRRCKACAAETLRRFHERRPGYREAWEAAHVGRRSAR